MSDEVLVKVENVSKKFCRGLKKSLWYGVQDIAGELFGRNSAKADLRPDEFWVLKDISFELRRGESLGLIGRNGAGKTTLLRLLNGLIKPDKGRITVRGQVGALIALGAGFNPILTGRENIYVNTAVLGIPKRKVDSIIDEIIHFAGIEEFIDTPVQSYSSGMGVRLGFAVAAQLEPDVLLVDEVLAVGDVAFQLKCYSKMNSLISKGTTIILVSHNMQRIMQHTDRALFLDSGKVACDGEAEEACKLYLLKSQQVRENEPRLFIETLTSGLHMPARSDLKDVSFKMVDACGNEKTKVMVGEEMAFQFSFHFSGKTDGLEIGVALYRDDGLQLTAMNTLTDGVRLSVDNNTVRGTLEINQVSLAPGKYTITFSVKDRQEYVFRGRPIEFWVQSDKVHWGFIDLSHKWKIEYEHTSRSLSRPLHTKVH